MFAVVPILLSLLPPSPQEKTNIPPRDLAEIFPSTTLAYFGWSGHDSLAEPCAGTALGKIAAEPECARFRSRLWEAVDKLVFQALGENKKNIQNYESAKRMLDSVFRRPTALALIELQGPVPQLAFVIDLGTSERERQFTSDFESLLASTGLPAPRPEEGKKTWLRMLPLPAPGGVFYGALRNHFVLALGIATAQQLESGLSDASPSLARDGKLASDRQRIVAGGAPRATTCFVDVEGLLARARGLVPMMGGDLEMLDPMLSTLGLDTIESWTAETHLLKGGFLSTSFVRTSEIASPQPAPVTEEELRWVPRDASFCSATRANLGAEFRFMLDMTQRYGPTHVPDVEDLIREKESIERSLGFTFEEGLLDLMGERFLLFDAPGNSGIWLTGLTVLMDSRDPERFESNLSRLIERLMQEFDGPKIEIVRNEYHGREIVTLKLLGLPVPVAPSWTRIENRILAGLYPQTVRAALDRLAAGNPVKDSILSHPDFERGVKATGGIGSEFHFGNTRKAIEWAYPLLLPLAQTGLAGTEAEGFDLDITDLPGQAALTRHAFGRISTVFYEDEGVRSLSYGALPFSLPLVDGLQGRSSLGSILILGAILFPAIEGAREKAMMTANSQTLRQVALAAIQFEQDRGQLPKTLDDLRHYLHGSVPKAAGDSSPQPSFVLAPSKIGRRAERPDREVCAYLRVNLARRGMLPVAFWDGHVEMIPVEQLQKFLTENR